jgi:pimeloyl-ACP methyl ester carboxylesterase
MSVDELAALVAEATPEQERGLREQLGDDGFRRARTLVVQGGSRGRAEPRGNVVVLHGIMGAELSTVALDGTQSKVWLNAPAIVGGALMRLRLAEDGKTPYDRKWSVRASGILKRYYVELLLSLHADWRVEPFWYDWRRDLNTAAVDLDAHLTRHFPDQPVHLVAHSMGGLVARTFVANRPDRWASLADGERGGRLVMLGTPNLGSYAIPQAIVGLERNIHKLAMLDWRHSREDLLSALNTFPGTLHMLPSPAKRPTADGFYDAETWDGLHVSQDHLDAARAHHELLADKAVDPDRMVYVAGNGVATLADVDPSRAADADAYTLTRAGDGRVPHELGLLDGVPAYFVNADHNGVTAHPDVLGALTELLTTGRTERLPDAPPVTQRGGDEATLKQEYDRVVSEELAAFERRVGPERGNRLDDGRRAPADERELENDLVRGFLTPTIEPAPPKPPSRPPPAIKIRLVNSAIQDVHEHPDNDTPPDVITTGHYRDVLPQASENALDEAISGVRTEQDPVGEHLLLKGFSLRGTLRGRLAEPFMLPDPRDPTRLVTIIGMGEPGRFGEAELTVLARELAWALGRLGRKHLATVVIGAGNGNLSIDEAVTGWIRGLRRGLAGEDDTLETVTFVEWDPRRIRALDSALKKAAAREQANGRLAVDYACQADLEAIDEVARKHAAAMAIKDYDQGGQAGEDLDDAPTRVVVTLDGEAYRFGAITANAAVPERRVPIDPSLVEEANEELALEGTSTTQLDRGQFLRKLVFPGEFDAELASRAPFVMLLDSTTARVHWEMVGHAGVDPLTADAEGLLDGFLGTSRGFTRQLRTQYAPPPEPPPPPRRVLRALVIADPAADKPLAGAEAEGIRVAELLGQFNTTYATGENRIEVKRLFGPVEATRTNVLRELAQRSYDVLHFAGHCIYVEGKPQKSGWIFTDGDLIATNELSRIDRIPKFVFSNACESGVTIDDARDAKTDLAPSFAGAFFARGVSNFVCTAWPVNDTAALEFAATLYRHLLGLTGDDDDAPAGIAHPMHVAMRAARRAIALEEYGIRTWGAYQHYGDPHFRLFDRLDGAPPDADSEAPADHA